MVSDLFGFTIQPNKAIVGQNAFRHSSGIHQDAFLKERTTFEIMEPESVGWRGEALVLGKLSGRAGLKARLQDIGYNLDDQELAELFPKYKELADQKREVMDRDLEALMAEQHRFADTEHQYQLAGIRVVCGDQESPAATVTLTVPDGGTKTVTAEGTGPVDAVCKAVDEILGRPINLTEFSVSAVTEGIDAIGEVTMRVEDDDGHVYAGRGGDTDIIVASAKAYVNAINRMLVLSSSRPGGPTAGQ
jgi:2-isopropylmalate synthase